MMVTSTDQGGGDVAAGAIDGGGAGKVGVHSIRYGDGSEYTGGTLDGRRHGEGRWVSSTAQYEGQWFNDNMHGRGKHVWADGRKYEGNFEGGKFNGQGKMSWTSPGGTMVYEGNYVDDLKDGQGKFTWADGRSYEGEWSAGNRNGRGIYTNSKGERRAGVWQNNKFKEWDDEAKAVSSNSAPGTGPGSPRLEGTH